MTMAWAVTGTADRWERDEDETMTTTMTTGTTWTPDLHCQGYTVAAGRNSLYSGGRVTVIETGEVIFFRWYGGAAHGRA